MPAAEDEVVSFVTPSLALPPPPEPLFSAMLKYPLKKPHVIGIQGVGGDSYFFRDNQLSRDTG